MIMPMPWEAVGEAVGDAAGAVAGGVARGVEAVGDVLDIGEPSGNDHGSSNWAAWGHAEIRSMLDTTVDPADVAEGSLAWSELCQHAERIVTALTGDLESKLSEGWRGAAADAAIRSLAPVNDWIASIVDSAERTTQLMDASGSSVGQAKRAVPPPVQHDWGQSLTSFVRGGPLGVGVDAFAQDEAQEAARAEAVRIMTNVYSAPINEHQAAVPDYPPLADPTLRPAEPTLTGGSPAGTGLGTAAVPGAAGGSPGGPPAYQPSAAAGLQGGAGGGQADGGQLGSGQLGGGPRQVGGGPSPGAPGFGGQGFGPGAGAAASAVPFVPPMAGGRLGGDERARRGFRGGVPGGGRVGGAGGRVGGGGPGAGAGSFGPRGSGAAATGPGAGAGEGRAGGGAGGGRGGAGVGGVPVAGAGAGRGRGGEDTEHQRPSYLIEMNDIFGDGRKVAPPVIGEDPPESYR